MRRFEVEEETLTVFTVSGYKEEIKQLKVYIESLEGYSYIVDVTHQPNRIRIPLREGGYELFEKVTEYRIIEDKQVFIDYYTSTGEHKDIRNYYDMLSEL